MPTDLIPIPPAVNFYGDIDVPYIITDSQGATATAVLHIDALKIKMVSPTICPLWAMTLLIRKPMCPYPVHSYKMTAIPMATNELRGHNDHSCWPSHTNRRSTGNSAGRYRSVLCQRHFIIYTPPAGYVGPDIISYTLCDVTSVFPHPVCSDGIIHFLVAPEFANTTLAVNDENSTWQDVECWCERF